MTQIHCDMGECEHNDAQEGTCNLTVILLTWMACQNFKTTAKEAKKDHEKDTD